MAIWNNHLEKIYAKVNVYLSECMEEMSPSCPPILQEAMKYSVLGEGKRLRPVLAIAVSEMFQGKEGNIFPTAAALEFIHCYSLVHDDLPAMDNDEYRRGNLTTHKKFGEAMGILAGDALLTHAFAIIAEKTEDKEVVAPLVYTLAYLAGIGGMVSGQAMDILSENQTPTPELVERIHNNKTGALILAACKAGAIAAKVSSDYMEKIETYGKNIGLAFQVMDDLLDVCGTKETTGKATGKDQTKGKITYPAIWGIDKSKEILLSLCEKACQSIASIPNNEHLLYIAHFVTQRNK